MWRGNIEKQILFEDRQILVCHKPAGLAVQSARVGTADMESLLKNYLAKKEPGKIPYLGVVHRLDQPVEGVLLFARTPKAARDLSAQIAGGQMKKLYLAVTGRCPSAPEGTLEDYLKKDGRTNTSAVVPKGTEGAKKARLSYRVEQVLPGEEPGTDRCLVRIRLETGRHHQIRVQMAHAGMPLLGDQKYGNAKVGDAALALCADCLTFMYPGTKKEKTFRVEPEGAAFQKFLK